MSKKDKLMYSLWVRGNGHSPGHYTPRRAKEWAALVAAKWQDKYKKTPNFKNPVELQMAFHYQGLNMADIDHLFSAVLNALQGLAWQDDSLVWHVVLDLVPESGVDGVEIRVGEI